MKGFILAAATAATMLVAGATQAATFTYATYGENGTWKSIQYTNTGGTTPSGTLSAYSAPGAYVSFKFNDDPSDNVTLPGYLTAFNNAVLSLNASVSAAATVDADGGVTQLFNNGTIAFIGAPGSPYDAANLLTITFNKLKLTGNIGEDSATTISSTPSTSFTITSDFFNFANATGSNFSLSMSSVIPSLSVGANGALDSFSANSSGVFASNPAPTFIPEPGMLGLFGFGAIGLGFARRRTK